MDRTGPPKGQIVLSEGFDNQRLSSGPSASARSAVRGGGAAGRFDPPLWRQHWRLERSLPREAFLVDARARWAAGAGSFERVLWHGGLHLDGRPLAPAADAAGAAEEVAARLPPVVAAGSRVAAWGFRHEPEPVPFGAERILRDAHGVVAVDKPAWLPVQATRASQRLCLERVLRELTGCASLVAVHRLDRQTSGVVLFARTPAVARRLGLALRDRRVARRYLAVSDPAPRADRFRVEGDLVRVPDAARFRFGLSPAPCRGGRFSATAFRCLARAGGRAWLEALPRTGRSHQIRVHLAAVGAPVAGDPVYGPPGREPSAPRLQLHAASLRLALVEGAAPVEIAAPLPADFLSPPRPPRPPGPPQPPARPPSATLPRTR